MDARVHVHTAEGPPTLPGALAGSCLCACRYLEVESEMERTYRVKQDDLAREVDVTSASKVRGRY